MRTLLIGLGREVIVIVADPDGEHLPGEVHRLSEEVLGPSPVELSTEPPADALALLMYTSGTTGVPQRRDADPGQSGRQCPSHRHRTRPGHRRPGAGGAAALSHQRFRGDHAGTTRSQAQTAPVSNDILGKFRAA